MALREFAHKQYIVKRQQDVAEFITHLCEKSDNLQTVLKHELIITRRCPTCENTRTDEPINSYILSLALPNCNDVTLQDIINFNIDTWNCTSALCNNDRQSFKDEKTFLTKNNKILILQLELLFLDSNVAIRKKCNLNVKNVDEKIVVINKKHYKVISGLFHHGQTIKSGHYTTMLRVNDYWLRVDDLQVKRTSWPENSRDVYVFFLEEVPKQVFPQSLIQNNFIKISELILRDKNDYQKRIQSNNEIIVDNNKISYVSSNPPNKSSVNNTPVVMNLLDSRKTVSKNNKYSKYYQSHKAEILEKRKSDYHHKKKMF